jgi:hypothetical protein
MELLHNLIYVITLLNRVQGIDCDIQSQYSNGLMNIKTCESDQELPDIPDLLCHMSHFVSIATAEKDHILLYILL